MAIFGQSMLPKGAKVLRTKGDLEAPTKPIGKSKKQNSTSTYIFRQYLSFNVYWEVTWCERSAQSHPLSYDQDTTKPFCHQDLAPQSALHFVPSAALPPQSSACCSSRLRKDGSNQIRTSRLLSPTPFCLARNTLQTWHPTMLPALPPS